MKPEKLGGGVFLYANDCLKSLNRMKENSVDSVCTDPPYHLVSITKRFGKNNSAPAKHGKDGSFKRLSKGFMGSTWDGGDVAFRKATWKKVLRVMKPGAHLVAFCGDRNYHRLVCAIEDAGFEIRHTIAWIYGSGFPKSHDVSKGIDKAAGAERTEIVGKKTGRAATPVSDMRGGKLHAGGVTPGVMDLSTIYAPATDAAREWEGWGSALKPAMELICLARKPLSEKSIAQNVLKWGTGALNIDACRIGLTEGDDPRLGGKGDWASDKMAKNVYNGGYAGIRVGSSEKGRWPANVTHDGSEEVVDGFSKEPKLRARDKKNGITNFAMTSGRPPHSKGRWPANVAHDGSDEVAAGFPYVKTGGPGFTKENHNSAVYVGPASSQDRATVGYDDSGSAARFFFTAKADADERIGLDHPTVKPIDLMQWLVRMVTPKGGYVLDCFAGTGTTGEAAWREGFKAILMEAEPKHQGMIRKRIDVMLKGKYEREVAKMARKKPTAGLLYD